MQGLAEAIVRRGGQIFERTPVFKQKGTVVSTKDGRASVEAQGAVVLATNSPLNHNLLVHARQQANRTYVVCLKLPKGALRYVLPTSPQGNTPPCVCLKERSPKGSLGMASLFSPLSPSPLLPSLSHLTQLPSYHPQSCPGV